MKTLLAAMLMLYAGMSWGITPQAPANTIQGCGNAPCAPGPLTALPSGVTLSSPSQLPPILAISFPCNTGTSAAAPSTACTTAYVQCANNADDIAVNAALATNHRVVLLNNACEFNNPVFMNGNVLQGEGQHKTLITIGAGFSQSATGVVVLQDANYGSNVRDLGFYNVQPVGFNTATTGAQASGTTITVSSSNASHIAVGNYVYDVTTHSAIPIQTTVSSISGTAPTFTLTLSATVTGVGSGDTINVIAGRTNVAALGTCDAVYIPCSYPPDIDASAGYRPFFNDLYFFGAWQCISMGAVIFDIRHIECGAANIGLSADGGLDFSYVEDWFHQTFGWQFTSPSNMFNDGATIAMQFGRVDGLTVHGAHFFDGNLVITANATTGGLTHEFVSPMFDGHSSISIAGGTNEHLSGGYKGSDAGSGVSPITVTNGIATLDGFTIFGGGIVSNPEISVTGGKLRVQSGRYFASSTSTADMLVTGGVLDVENEYIDGMPSTLTAPVLQETTGGSLIARNNTFHAGSTGTAISVAVDNAGNVVTDNFLAGTSASLPTGATSGYYDTPGIHMAQGTTTLGTSYQLCNTAAATNQKCWFIGATSSGGLAINTLGDNGTTAGNGGITLSRSGTTISSISMGNTTDNPTFSWNSLGKSSWGGILQGNQLQFGGTKFTAVGTGCTIATTTGDATGGSFTLATGPCTSVAVTMGSSASAPNGWLCPAWDETTKTVLIGGNSGSTSQTATFTIPAGAGTTDVIGFACLAQN